VTSRLPRDRDIRVLVWSSHGAHHWRVSDGRIPCGGQVADYDQAWACALAALRGALFLRRLEAAERRTHLR